MGAFCGYNMAITQARCPKAEANQKNQNAPKRDTTDAFGWMLDPVLPARRQRRSPPTKRAAPRHTHDEQPAEEEESLALTPSLINARRTNAVHVEANKGGDIVGRIRKMS